MQTRTKKLLWAAIGVALGLGTIWVAANPMKIQTTWSSTKAVFTKLYLGGEKGLLEWTIEKDGKSLAIIPDGVSKNLNSVSGGAFMLGWIGNSNLSNGLPGSGSIILAGIGNIVGKNASNTLSLASQNTETLGGESSVIIAANGVTGSATFGLIAASEGALHNQGKDSIVLATHATEATTVPNGGLLIGNAQINANGAFVFNAKSGRLTATKDHSFIVNTHNGMIIGSNSGSIDGAKIPLTVNGAVKVGTEFNDKAGMVLKTSPDNKFSCLCFNGSDGATGVALNLGDACTQLCKTGSPNLKAVCGMAARTYEKNESASTFTNFCAVGSLQGASPSMPLPWQTVSWSCQGVGGASNNVSCTATKKPCGSAEILVNGLCVPVYNCGGSLPAHAVAWSNSPQSNLTTQATWGYSATNTNLACKFGCAAGYTWNNNACVAQTYSCQGILPEGARPVNGDDTNLTSNLSWQAVASNTARKCEYTCAEGYTLHNGSCARFSLDEVRLTIYTSSSTDVFHLLPELAIVNTKNGQSTSETMDSYSCSEESISITDTKTTCVWKPKYIYDGTTEYDFRVDGSFSWPWVTTHWNLFEAWASFWVPLNALNDYGRVPTSWHDAFLYSFQRRNIDKNKKIAEVSLDLRI